MFSSCTRGCLYLILGKIYSSFWNLVPREVMDLSSKDVWRCTSGHSLVGYGAALLTVGLNDLKDCFQLL